MSFRSWVEYTQRWPRQTRMIVLTCVYAGGAGLATVAFQSAMNALYDSGLVALAKEAPVHFVVGSLVVILSTSLLAGWLLAAFAPEAAGSGVPQLKSAFWKDFGHIPWRVAWVKFIAGVLSIGGGSSLGREGPSVHLAGAVAANLSGLAGEPKQGRRAPAAAGAAAGLAAAFNTPMAAISFVLEEIIGDLNSRYLGGLLVAAVIGAFSVHAVIGREPAFSMPHVETPTWIGYALTPLVAALAALVGVQFQKSSLRLRSYSKGMRRIPAWMRPALGGLITWGLGVSVFVTTDRLGVFGLGYQDLSDALAGSVVWKVAALLLAAKFVATVVCYGFGGCGGIFSPALFFGGMTGLVLAGLVGLEFDVPQGDKLTLIVVGMSATLGAVVRAPVTGVLIVFEMTHEFGLVPALMLGALVSQAISRKMLKHSFYDALLKQDGVELAHVQPPRDLRSWQQLPVSAIANFKPVLVKSTETSELDQLLRSHPYARFPVVTGDRFIGLLTRQEAQVAVREKRPPNLLPGVTCEPTASIKQLQFKLIESQTGLVVILDPQHDGKPLGVITLHDLLRAETGMARDATGL